jgi:two-component system, LytTR family, response regulator
MVNCVIVDDEPKNINVLRTMLEEFCPDLSIVDEALDAEEAERVIRATGPDLVFLDIEMPYGNAFDLLDRLMPIEFEVIFITAFNEYSLKAFKYSALDYLLKPVNIEELRSAVQKASERMVLKQSNQRLNNLLNNLKQQDPSTYKLALPKSDGLIFIRIDAIIRCEASKGYTFLYLKDGTRHLSTRTIKEYEDLLPPPAFLRIHNSHIINLMSVKKYQKGRGGCVEMEDNTVIEVASRRKNEFLKRFGM